MFRWLQVGYVIVSVTARGHSMQTHPTWVNVHYLDTPGESLIVAPSCLASLTCLCEAVGVDRHAFQVKDEAGDLVHIRHDSVWEERMRNASSATPIDVLVSRSVGEMLQREENRVLTYLKQELEEQGSAEEKRELGGVKGLVEKRIPRFAAPKVFVRGESVDIGSCNGVRRRTLVGFVVDARTFKYQLQALHLVRSIFAFGGGLAETSLLAVVIGSLGYEIEDEFTRLGVKMKPAVPVNETLRRATPHCNKLRFFLTEEARDVEMYDKVVYLDTDVLVLDDPIEFFEKADSSILFRTGTTLWSDAVFRFKIWEELCDLCGASTRLNVTVGWPNTGVIAMPTWRVPLLAFEWIHFVDYLSFHIPEEDQYFLDTLAFIFALEAMARVHDGGRVEQALWRLPWQLNAQLNWPKYDMIRNGWVERNSSQYPIVFLQYAQESIRFDDRGRFAQYDSETVACFPFLEQVNTKIQALYT